MKLDIKLLIMTVVAGLVAFVANQILYSALVEVLPRPVLIAILVAVLVIICCIAISVVVSVTNETQDEFLFLESRGMICVGLAVCLLLVGVITALLEWVYDHEEVKTNSATSYVFILDESGSITGSDPNFERYEAVKTVVGSMTDDFPYAVYMFSNDCVRIREMAPVSDGVVERPADADYTMLGGTNISAALRTVYADLTNGQLDGGDRPQVILLTDGYASDMGLLIGKEVLKDYKSSGIRVSTVGLGQVDEVLLQEIADKTDGLFIRVDEASQLAQGFGNVTYQEAQRDLISARNIVEKKGLYLFLRILFLTVIGAMVAFMKAMACADSDATGIVLIEGAIAALVGALIVELGLALKLPAFLVRLVYWVLLAATPRFIRAPIHMPIHDRRIDSHRQALDPQKTKEVEKAGNRNAGGGQAGFLNWDD